MSTKEALKAKVTWVRVMQFAGENSASHKIPMEATMKFDETGKDPIPLEIMLSTLGGYISVDMRYLLGQKVKEYKSFDASIEGVRRDQVPSAFEKIHAKVKISGYIDY